MSAAGGSSEAARRQPPWDVSLLTPAEPGRRNRRTIDGVLVATAAVVAGLAAVAARSAPDVDQDIGQAVAIVLGWAPGVWRAALLAALVLAGAVIVAAVLFTQVRAHESLGCQSSCWSL